MPNMTKAPKIERVPLPANALRGKKSPWPFASMKVGDSFLVPETKPTAANASALRLHPIRSAASAWKRSHPGFNYTIQQTADGLRCWRIETEVTATS